MTQTTSTFLQPVDVVIVGGGPIGCLIGAQLAKFGCRPLVLERDDKASAPIYGRATTLWPRTLELYDQLDMLDPLLEVGVVSQNGMNFRNGKISPGGLVFGYRMDKHGDTAYGFALHLRQRLTERAFETILASHHYPVLHQHQLESWTTSTDDSDEYPVTCHFRDLRNNELYSVRTKYLVGADGGKSFVRKTAGIAFEGNRSGAKWIRMDALVKTDMPNPRLLNSIQSDSHGLVLFCPIDEGKTRIGYVFNEELHGKYDEKDITAEVAMAEAKNALAPFSLEFLSLDWYTLYGIGQRVASTFVKDRVILAGDACHTHSSGSAQGLNTGSHDAVNLAWKLALVCRGLGSAEVLLDSYNRERLASVQQVIENDVVIATLISGNLPERFKDRKESPRDLLTEWFDNAKVQEFTLGLGVGYESNTPSPLCWETRSSPLSTINSGARGPDVAISRLGTNESCRLHKVLRNTGRLNIVVFTGSPASNQDRLTSFRKETTAVAKAFPRLTEAVTYTTIIPGQGFGAAEVLGQKPWGMSWFDTTGHAHSVYGVDVNRGAVIVLRPDGHVSAVLGLDQAGALQRYLQGFLIA